MAKNNIFSTTKEDINTWQEYTSNIKKQKNVKNSPALNITDTATDNIYDVHFSFSQILNFKKAEKIPNYDLEELNLEKQAGIDKNTYKKFKSGQMPIDGNIDLHGMTEKEAKNKFNSFINQSYTQNKRFLIVITGKGFLNTGVLKNALPIWINDEDIRHKILAFSVANPQDGGSGAYYVLLKRK